MNCIEFEAVLNDMIDRRERQLPDAAAAHMDCCVNCVQIWRDYELLELAIHETQAVQIRESFSDLLMRSVLDEFDSHHVDRLISPSTKAEGRITSLSTNSERMGTLHSHRSQYGIVAVSAACLTLACWIGVNSIARTTGSSVVKSHQINNHNQRLVSANPSTTEVAESVATMLAELKSQYDDIASETAATAHDFAAAIPTSSPWTTEPFGFLSSHQNEVSTEIDTQQNSNDAKSLTNHDHIRPQSMVPKLPEAIGSQIEEAVGFLWLSERRNSPKG